jgi:hypothetical protein
MFVLRWPLAETGTSGGSSGAERNHGPKSQTTSASGGFVARKNRQLSVASLAYDVPNDKKSGRLRPKRKATTMLDLERRVSVSKVTMPYREISSYDFRILSNLQRIKRRRLPVL